MRSTIHSLFLHRRPLPRSGPTRVSHSCRRNTAATAHFWLHPIQIPTTTAIGPNLHCSNLCWRMQADWSVECGTDDPAVVVPWSDPAGGAVFFDLVSDPDAIDFIPEAEAHPPLMQALRALNAARSPVFTAKCDAWPLAADELAQLRLDLGFDWDGDDADGGF